MTHNELQRDAKATDLFETFSACDLIREIRMMFEFSNQNRGFCFILYMDEVNASRKRAKCILRSDWLRTPTNQYQFENQYWSLN